MGGITMVVVVFFGRAIIVTTLEVSATRVREAGEEEKGQ